jgi:hypothetical protein
VGSPGGSLAGEDEEKEEVLEALSQSLVQVGCLPCADCDCDAVDSLVSDLLRLCLVVRFQHVEIDFCPMLYVL